MSTSWSTSMTVFHMFGYLKQVPKRKICLDPCYPNIPEESFVKHDWYDFYRDAKETIPSDAPKPRGQYVTTHCFVNANHADEEIGHRCVNICDQGSDHLLQQEAEHGRGEYVWCRICSDADGG